MAPDPCSDPSMIQHKFRILCFAGFLGITPAMAGGAPPAALDKTVTLSWSTSGTGKRPDGSPISFTNLNTRVIYISSAGRPFLRKQISSSSKKYARGADIGPDQSASSGGNVAFQGNMLVGTEAFASGARQYRVTFDASFTSCSLSVVEGKSGGAKIKRRGPDGVMYEIDSVGTGSPACSVQGGNAFAH
jgi:hypothetical protein